MNLFSYVESKKPIDKSCHMFDRCTFRSPSLVIEYRNAKKTSIVKEWDFEEFRKTNSEYVALKSDHTGRLYVDYGQRIRRCNHKNKIRISIEKIGGFEEDSYWECTWCGERLG